MRADIRIMGWRNYVERSKWLYGRLNVQLRFCNDFSTKLQPDEPSVRCDQIKQFNCQLDHRTRRYVTYLIKIAKIIVYRSSISYRFSPLNRIHIFFSRHKSILAFFCNSCHTLPLVIYIAKSQNISRYTFNTLQYRTECTNKYYILV